MSFMSGDSVVRPIAHGREEQLLDYKEKDIGTPTRCTNLLIIMLIVSLPSRPRHDDKHTQYVRLELR